MSCFNGEKCKEMRDDWFNAMMALELGKAAKITVDGAKVMAAGVKESLTTEKPKPTSKRKVK